MQHFEVDTAFTRIYARFFVSTKSDLVPVASMQTPDEHSQSGFLNPFGVSDREVCSTALGLNERAIYSYAYQQQHPISSDSIRTSISSIRPSSPADMASTLSPDRLRVRSDTRASAQSLDGETLRPRADSTISSADTAVRSRANSEATNAPTKMEYDDVSVADALNPDPRNEQDFIVPDNKFAFSPGQLNKMQNPKSLAAFQALGGMQGLERGLRTDLTSGLSVDETLLQGSISFSEATSPDYASFKETAPPTIDAPITESSTQFQDRIGVFCQNRLPARKSTGFLKLFWQAYNDKIIILLTIAAIVSLSLGIYETTSEGSGVDWIEGVAICVAILIVTIVTAANDWQKERQFAKLNKRVSAYLSSVINEYHH